MRRTPLTTTPRHQPNAEQGLCNGRMSVRPSVRLYSTRSWVNATVTDVKKRFFNEFYFGHVFYVFNVLLFSKRFFLFFKKRWLSSERQAD